MKKILFVIAMEKEAKDIAKELGLEEKNTGNGKVFEKNNISLLISGIGKQQTAINLTKYIENNRENLPDIIINVGYVGSTKLQIGSWVSVNKSYNYEWLIPGEQKYEIEGYNKNLIKTINELPDKITLNENEKQQTINNVQEMRMNGNSKKIKVLPCYSAESFVTLTNITDDVVFDMELHSIYMVCCMYGIELISLKKVSDNLSLDDYYKNIDMKEVMELTSSLKLLGMIN